MKTKILSIFFIFGALLLLGAGCIQFNAGGTAKADGGVFKSIDRGGTWAQKASLASTGGGKSITGLNIKSIVMDPSDNQALYALAAEGGVYFTYDGAESWRRLDALGGAGINAFLIDQRNKCVLFSGSGNRAAKSIDCGRTWQAVYLDSRPQQVVTALAQNPSNGNIIYLGTSGGDLIRSADSGASWTPINIFGSRIARIIFDPFNSGIIYVGTMGGGVWKSDNGGADWKNINEKMGQFSENIKFVDIIPSRSEPGTYIHVSRYGLLKTVDGGENWKKINLLTPPGTTDIYSLAIDPKDGKIIYYSTGSTFYKSTDGGNKWITKKLPGSRVAAALLIDKDAPAIIYMAALRVKEQSPGMFGF